MLTIKRQHTRIYSLLLTLLLLGGMVNEAWAAKVTYHVLTLPINASSAGMVDAVKDKRLEAIRVFVDNATEVRLPDQFKSPLAKNFKYWTASQVTASAATFLYEGSNRVKEIYYTLDTSTETAEGTAVSSDIDIYVTYDYIGDDNAIVELDGSKVYNIGATYGFLAYNRGRNNRPAVVPRAKVTSDALTSEDFVYIDNPGSGITTYWSSGDNKNPKVDVESQFHFQFKLEGNDPYNIVISTAYNRDITYIEKNEGTSNFVYKWYKEGILFASGNSNAYIASDVNRKYTQAWVSGNSNPTNPSYETSSGYFHGIGTSVCSSFALLNNTTSTGYVFMGSRTYNSNGTFNAPTGSNNSYKYNYLKLDNNNLTINKLTSAEATTKYSVDATFYEIKDVTFNVKTPFGNTLSASVKMSDYKILNDDIQLSDIPSSLERKYCTFTKFYKDAALTQEITKYSQMAEGGTDIYVGYEVQNTPFQAITPAASYTTATWYELTDAGSTQEYGRKIKNNSGTYKNNGASGEYEKESEFAFVGDPYELKVLYRKGSEDAGSNSYVTLSTYNTWDIPDDDTNGSFLLRKYNDTGYWNWNTGQPSGAVTYGSNLAFNTGKDAQAITFTVSGLNGSKYFKVTTGGADVSQIVSVTPTVGSVEAETATSATVTVQLAANSSGANKAMTVTIQEYSDADGNTTSGTASVITITQGTASSVFEGNTVEYSTVSSTRIKVLELPKKTFTYKIVDKSGRIAVTASASQTIFSPLSLASIPSIIISPFILDETIKFYDSYTDRNSDSKLSRLDFHSPTEQTDITETPNADASIFVTYTTTRLSAKPFKLSEDQEIFARLNGQYIYYDAGTLKSTETSTSGDKYKWKLRNQDPYAMLLDNLGARTDLSVSGSEDVTVPTDDDGTTASQSRQKGAWVDVASIVNEGALSFTTTRADAQQFIAKSSARAGVYEVMVATGDGVDASTTYYNIGRPDATTVKIYNNVTYQAGDDEEIKFRLEENVNYVYHLIDKANHELLTAESKSPELVLPAEYQSPLVGTANYSYYGIDQFNVSGEGANAVYTLKGSPTKLTNISGLLATYHYTTTSSDATNSWTEASTVDDMESDVKKLKVAGHYYYKVVDTYYDVEVTKPYYTDIYVTYVKNDLVTFNSNGSPYLLKFRNPYAAGYRLEDGNDKLTKEQIQAVYPYCNGDGNLNIYGTAMNEEQMNGGANTRPRWIWYFDNPTGYTDDPYHVTIRSRSTISYNSVSYPTYLQTFAVHFNQDAGANTEHIVTGGSLPGVASEHPTEYMILGTRGNYRLMTTNKIAADLNGDGDTSDDGENERHAVTSLEQYWKTYNMIKLVVLGISKDTNAYSDDPATFVVPDDKRSELLTAQPNWHSYAVYANATRWNGYNNKEEDGVGKKVVENLEHWFQTFDMGNGAFDIESADIPPVLVLLDRHGWEIMRKPLPTISTYPNGDELEALRAYDSPMVKEYHFFNNATKASGCHKYSLRIQNNALRDEIKVSGTAYTSTSLATLPPITASGVKDGNGFIQDFYVTYTVKEEYEKSYTYTFTDNGDNTYTETGTPSKFLVLQNGRFLKKENDVENPYYISKPIYEHTNPTGGNVYDLILSPRNNTVTILADDKIADYNFWYVGPNLDIDKEMGIKWTQAGTTELATKKAYANTSKVDYMQTTGFDPYNLQIKNADDGRFVTSHMTSATLVGGAMVGNYDSEEDEHTTMITLAAGFDLSDVDPEESTGTEGHDHTNITITNQTFMAVSDANGNMQLMPRFDHTKRINTSKSAPYLTTLEDPVDHTVASVDDNSSMGPQTTFLVRPQIMEYLIIDNQGREALRYKRVGEYYPAITEHFKSPLATDFKFYKELTLTDGVYTEISTKADISSKEITGSFADAELNGDTETVYVRYDYNENYDVDGEQILQGKWFTIKLNNLDVWASGTINTSDGTGVLLYADDTVRPTKPGTVNASAKTWQWKFLQAPTDPSSEYYTAPDPYAIELYNRSANYSTTLGASSPMSVPIKVNGTDRFSLLSHPDGGYALAVNGLRTYTYSFLNGASMTTSVAATTAAENTDNAETNHFTIKSNALSAGAQLILNDDVDYNYVYKVINNGGADYVITNPGYLAIEATQDNAAASSNGYVPYLPEAAQTPLLNADEDYLYYGSAGLSEGKYTVVIDTKLFTLYGLYDDQVFVRYKKYDMNKTEYKVPNEKAIVSGHVAKGAGSHDVALNINGELPYNIIWYNDNMMFTEDAESTTISDGGSKALSGDALYVWYFTGNDPYGLKIEHKKTGNYIYSSDGSTCALHASNYTPFMLLKKTGYDYGVLQVTGGTKMLSGYGNILEASDATHPKEFIIFGLSVHDLIYRLVIAKTCPNKTAVPLPSDQYVDIPYSEANSPLDPNYKTGTGKLRIYGTTQRDLELENTGGGTHYKGEKYQLGETISWGGTGHTYSHHAGSVSIGDVLEVPSAFYRPNCTYDFYVEGIYNTNGTTSETELDNDFKGLKLTNLMSDSRLIDKTVVVNIVYSFDKSLATNSGLDFVKSTDQNLWYTFETQQESLPLLARYTNTQKLTAIAGRDTRYTNDYLFTPVGDVYGFKMYNRYVLKNSSDDGDDDTRVMTTTSLVAGEVLDIVAPPTPTNGYEVYELLTGDVDGSFRVHPVVDIDDGNPLTAYNPVYVNITDNKLKLSTTPRDWTYGLDIAMLQPYYLGAGNVGGLTTTIKAGSGKSKSGKALYEDAVATGKITEIQNVVYDDGNIVDFTKGYYRLHSQPGISGISPVRYASGYLHETEKTAVSGGIPMHFYSRQGVLASFAGEDDGLGTGFTVSNATQGDIPIAPTENDPSTIFYVDGSNETNKTISNVTMSTQGLNVIGNKMGEETATTYRMIDIGGGIVVLVNPGDGNKYFNFTQTGNNYDLKYSTADSERLDDVKWCMEPANTLGLKVTMNDGGDDYYYATFYAPFDVLLPADDGNAFTCSTWKDTGLTMDKVPAVGDTYAAGKFVPANTPVVIRTNDNSGSISLTLPNSSPSSSLSSCVFTGQYLEQMLAVDASHDVYTFGLPFTSSVSIDRTNGSITAALPEKATTGVGFYINANPNKESDLLESNWLRNNRYVMHNKIYYRATGSGSGAREESMRGIQFVPVYFGDEVGEEQPGEEGENPSEGVAFQGDGCIYDMMGRKVATRQQVEDGSWRLLRPGIYILNGKKFRH